MDDAALVSRGQALGNLAGVVDCGFGWEFPAAKMVSESLPFEKLRDGIGKPGSVT